jgi:hypothetical protein
LPISCSISSDTTADELSPSSGSSLLTVAAALIHQLKPVTISSRIFVVARIVA